MNSSSAGFFPVPADERIVALDVLRGLALLGILLVNIEWFSRPIQELGSGLPPGLSGIDHALAWAVHVFLAGKFWILFSLLFGMGFATMLERAQAARRPFAGAYLRRIAVLLLIGLAHAWLLWVGDILHSYALAAVLLLLSRRWSATTQLRVGVIGYVGLGLLLLLAALAGDTDSSARQDRADLAARAAEAAAVYAGGSYGESVVQRLQDFRRIFSTDWMIVPTAWMIFLVGAWFVRSGRMRDAALQRGFHARLAAAGLTIGAALSIASALQGTRFPLGGDGEGATLPLALMLLGSLPLALGYLAVAMLVLGGSASRLLAWLAPAGRMALTNYLMQSVLGTLLFYGYGFALWGRLGYAQQLLLACAIFGLQAAWSHWWLARFRFGPMEGLWRWATYGRRPPMRLA